MIEHSRQPLEECLSTGSCLALAFLLLFSSANLWATDYRIGTAKVDITPTYPVRLSGFGFRRTESEGVTQKIWAKALAISDNQSSPAVLITVDNLGIPTAMVDQLAQALKDQADIDPERVSVLATHTHTAPMLRQVAPTLFGMPIPAPHQEHIDHYTHDLQSSLLTVALEAINNSQTASLEFGIGKADFAINRRTKGGPVDHDLPSLFVRNAENEIIAVYSNYACHCVTLSHNKISGDWAGYAQSEIEKMFPNCVALVGIGCGADANPASGVVGDDTQTAARQGKKIAHGIAEILKRPRAQVTGPVKVQSKTISLPFAPLPSVEEWETRAARTDAIGYHARINLDRLRAGQELPTELSYKIQTWSFGRAMAWVLLPGEVVVDYATRLKRELDESKVWITAYANDAPCYIPSERILREGGYEGGGAMVYYDRPTRLAAGIEDQIVNTVHSLVPAPFHPPPGTDGTAPKSPLESLQCFQTHPELEVQLVASEPLVIDPVAIQWDLEGQLWVAEMHDYPLGMKGGYEPGGRIKTLTDTNGDGQYDQATIFAEGVPFPTGLMPTSKGLLIGAAPDILLAQDLDRDGKADRIEPLFTGFADHNYQARVNSFSWGLDNHIYAANGLFGGQITPPSGGAPTDTRGHDFRFRLDDHTLEIVSGLTQQGRARNDFGNWFGCQNGILIQHYPLEQSYLPPGLPTPPAHSIQWHDSDPGKLYPISKPLNRFNDLDHQGRVTSACGLGIYRDHLLGEQYEGNAFVCEPVHNLVRRVVLTPTRGTFSAARASNEQDREFLSSTDPWFRPAQVITGPDGALWIVDMYRFLMEHPIWIRPDRLKELAPRAGDQQGRIYRIVRHGGAHEAPAYSGAKKEKWVNELEQANGTRRDLAQQAIVENQITIVHGELTQLASEHSSPKVRLQALSTLDGLDAVSPDLLLKRLRDPHPEIRARAVRLTETQETITESLLQAIGKRVTDPSPVVRKQVAYSIKKLPLRDAGRALARLLSKSQDAPYLSIAALSSAEKYLPAIVEVATKDPTIQFSESQWDALLLLMGQQSDGISLDRAFSILSAPNSQIQRDAQFSLIARHWHHFPASRTAHAAAKEARRLFDTPPHNEPLLVSASLLLGQENSERLHDVTRLSKALEGTNHIALRTACIDALARISTPQAFENLLALQNQLGPASKQQITARILERPAWTKKWLSQQTQTRKAINLTPLQKTRLAKHSDPEIRHLAEDLWTTASSKELGEALQSYDSVSTLRGDAEAGRKQFEVRCSSCHALHGIGKNIGPDLRALTDRTASHLIREILDPNRVSLDAYVDYEVEQTDGLILTGLITEETDTHIVLEAPNRPPSRISRDLIRSLRSTGLSLMPEGLAEGMSAQDMADLLAFLNQENKRTVPPRDPETIANFILANQDNPETQHATIDIHYALADRLAPYLTADPAALPALHYLGFVTGNRNEPRTLPQLLHFIFSNDGEMSPVYPLAILAGIFEAWASGGQDPATSLSALVSKPQQDRFWTQLVQARSGETPSIFDDHRRSVLKHRPLPGSTSTWKGFKRHDFTFKNRSAIIVAPDIASPSKPWIWRARFFGHEPQLDQALLKRGYHLVYIDIANQFGSPSAVALWNQFHSHLVDEFGFHPKAFLEGMSRGGLMLYNWAQSSPDKVAGIYADAPVLDFTSWPGGARSKTNAGQQRAWLSLLEAYGFKTAAEAQVYQGNPVNHVDHLIAHQIPIFHICGGADEVVPYDENTGRFKERYHRAGGRLFREIVKPHIGHHPHSLTKPKPLVEFVEYCYARLDSPE